MKLTRVHIEITDGGYSVEIFEGTNKVKETTGTLDKKSTQQKVEGCERMDFCSLPESLREVLTDLYTAAFDVASELKLQP